MDVGLLPSAITTAALGYGLCALVVMLWYCIGLMFFRAPKRRHYASAAKTEPKRRHRKRTLSAPARTTSSTDLVEEVDADIDFTAPFRVEEERMSASWSYSLYKAVGTVIGTMLGGYLSMLVGVRSLFPSVATFLIVSSIAMLLQRKHTPLSHQLIFVVTGIVGFNFGSYLTNKL